MEAETLVAVELPERQLIAPEAAADAAMDLFIAPTIGFDLLYVLVIIRLERPKTCLDLRDRKRAIHSFNNKCWRSRKNGGPWRRSKRSSRATAVPEWQPFLPS
jgi:hypothetical protein